MMTQEPYYRDLSPVTTGIAGKCPRCGRGRLFEGYLAVAPGCAACGLDFSFADAGDGAAWFIMLVVGFLAIGTALWIEVAYQPAYWVHALVALPLAVGLPLLLLRPVKGVLICQQYKTKAAEGRLARE
jgi:uncharacterized protein (DUF983 family)